MKLLFLFLINFSVNAEIINGKAAKDGEFLSVVHLNITKAYTGNVGSCSGTIISKRAILTAAHCLIGIDEATGFLIPPVSLSIRNSNIIKMKDSIKVNGDISFEIHPKYLEEFVSQKTGISKYEHDFSYDIGIIYMSKDSFTEERIAKLNLNGVDYSKSFKAVGYGVERKTEGFEEILNSKEKKKKVRIPKKNVGAIKLEPWMDNEIDNPEVIRSSFVKSSGDQKLSQVASGDSGGALFDHENKLSGVISSYLPISEIQYNRILYNFWLYDLPSVEEEGRFSSFVNLSSASAIEFLVDVNKKEFLAIDLDLEAVLADK